MNCETIDSILDDHLVARLGSLERQRAAEHVRGCARCSAAWAADDALRTENVAAPPPALFGDLVRRVAGAPVQPVAHSRRWWLAAAAAALVVVIAARFTAEDLAVIFTADRDALSVRLLRESTPPTLILPAAGSDASRFVAGRDYEVLRGGSSRIETPVAGRVEVTEFFMFECFPCYAFEPDLDRWESRAPSDVSLTHVPAMFNAVAELHARAYYTAEALDRIDVMHDEFYAEIHERGNALASRAALVDFFRRFGVDPAAFDAAFDSGEVDARMQYAAALNREYRIQATPTLVVAGRYRTKPSLRGSDLLALVDHLVAESRAAR
jgi:thiol:disulfide interchange protein DsbA